MDRVGHAPLKYSNEQENKIMMIVISILFLVLAIAFASFGFYIASLHNDWWVMYFLGPISIVLGFISLAFYPKKKQQIYELIINENGIHQHWHNRTTDEKANQSISFQNVDHVLVGLMAKSISSQQNQALYRLHALLIIMHNDDYFFQEIVSSKELYEWMKRLNGKVPSIRYTDYDLSLVFQARFDKKINFASAPSSADNIVSKHIGKESDENFLNVWEPGELKENK